MILLKPSTTIRSVTKNALEVIECAGRTAYKSEAKITDGSAEKFIASIIKRGHESVLEHASMSVHFVIDRGVSHELVRHRLAAFTQESTRYCNYKGGVTFIIPPWVDITPGEYLHLHDYKDDIDPFPKWRWFQMCLVSERCYKDLLADKWTPQQARSVLPNSLKTEITVTANMREWRHIFKLRCANDAHPQMREVMIPLLNTVAEMYPALFTDIQEKLCDSRIYIQTSENNPPKTS